MKAEVLPPTLSGWYILARDRHARRSSLDIESAGAYIICASALQSFQNSSEKDIVVVLNVMVGNVVDLDDGHEIGPGTSQLLSPRRAQKK